MFLTNSSSSTLAKPLSSSKTPSPIYLSSNLNKSFDLNSLINNTNQTSPSPIQPYLQFHPHPIQNHFLRRRKRGSGSWTRTERCRVILRHLNTLDDPLVRAKWMNTKKALTEEAEVVKQLDADFSF
ncbi:Katanin p60 ATPase-containing subunit A1 [Camellia lanceoleosa]|uniref:Katanin p60 ATPase-containing subunit A1 n=1 Tax=Camellia lanceoleosa TaxID=1840588 RepID=A0ACC0G9E8_9ERIC|nr:Katanin p60 ATPase-containing subunit A1 [Camellia lanceoleosa]